MRYKIGGLVTCSLAVGPGIAMGQAVGSGTSIIISPQLDRIDVAGSRIEPEFHSAPLPIGPLGIQPAMSVVSGYTSNVFNRPDSRSDVMLHLMPALRVSTDLAPHRLDLGARGTIRRFAKFTSENSEEFDIIGNGIMKLSNNGQLTASADFAHLIEARSSFGTVLEAAEPISYQQWGGDVGLDLELGSFRMAPSVSYQQLDYNRLSLENGQNIDVSFRDTRTIRGDLRISYDFSGLISGFASGSLSDIRSTSAARDIRRDARSITAAIGLKGELTPLLSGEVSLGYQSREYELPIYRDFSGVTFAADLQWYVTPLATLHLQAGRAFQNSGYREVAGILTDTIALTSYYDPLRNLRVSLSASYERGRYREVDTRTSRQSIRLNVEYRLSPLLSIGGYVSIVDQNVQGTPLAGAFTSASGGLGISITP